MDNNQTKSQTYPLVQRMYLMSIGAIVMMSETANRLGNRLVEYGEQVVAHTQAEDALPGTRTQPHGTEASTHQPVKADRICVINRERILHSLGLGTKKDIDNVYQQLDRLLAHVDQVRDGISPIHEISGGLMGEKISL